jgi:uncharacterized protein (DUF1800 family)
MTAWNAYHDFGAKTLLRSTAVPANLTPEADLDRAMDALFNHPNVGPFIGKRLIQRLVTSNPSPGYVSRVAAVFNNNGSGVRGDLWAVVRAILLDGEARTGYLSNPQQFGKLREPILRLTHLWRAFGATPNENDVNPGYWYPFPSDDLGQAPLRSPSVFNFFRPGFQRPNSRSRTSPQSPCWAIRWTRWPATTRATVAAPANSTSLPKYAWTTAAGKHAPRTPGT